MRLNILLLLVPACLQPVIADEKGQWQHGVSVFDEFKYGPDFDHFDYANPDAPKGGTLVLPTTLDFTSFTPFLPLGIYPTGAYAPGMLYDGLFVRANDEAYSAYGNLARRVKFTDDLSEVVVQLHPEAYWHDGEPITANDVKFTFDHVLENSASSIRAALSIIESVEILGEREVLFRFKRVGGLNKNSFAAPAIYIAILPEHYWRTHDLSKTTLEPPLGSGPYRIADSQQGQFLLYERVPDYWARDLAVHRGRHNFDYIRYELYRDATIAREALRKGLLDYRVESDPYLWRTGYNVPARERGWLVMRQNNAKVSSGFQSALIFNTRREKLADVRVREALTIAFDFEWTNRAIYDGFYARADSYFSGTELAARGLPNGDELALLEPFREQLPERVFTEPFVLPNTRGPGGNRDNLLRARELLAEAGWTVKSGRLVEAAGQRFEIEFLTLSANDKRTLLPYMDQLRQLGIASSIRYVESAQYVNRLRKFDYDVLLRSLGFSFPPGVEIRAHFTQSNANRAGIRSPVVDALVSKVLGARRKGQLVAAGRALDRTLLWGYYLIPIVGHPEPRTVYWNKFGQPTIDAEYVTSFPDTWWWDEARAVSIRLKTDNVLQ
jgi:microcin C transport system substrate-binding protein